MVPHRLPCLPGQERVARHAIDAVAGDTADVGCLPAGQNAAGRDRRRELVRRRLRQIGRRLEVQFAAGAVRVAHEQVPASEVPAAQVAAAEVPAARSRAQVAAAQVATAQVATAQVPAAQVARGRGRRGPGRRGPGRRDRNPATTAPRRGSRRGRRIRPPCFAGRRSGSGGCWTSHRSCSGTASMRPLKLMSREKVDSVESPLAFQSIAPAAVLASMRTIGTSVAKHVRSVTVPAARRSPGPRERVEIAASERRIPADPVAEPAPGFESPTGMPR